MNMFLKVCMRIKKMIEIACMLYNLAIIGITCYMCANYSYWFLLLLLLTGSYKNDRSEEEHEEDF